MTSNDLFGEQNGNEITTIAADAVTRSEYAESTASFEPEPKP
jgi:hypothetical protein